MTLLDRPERKAERPSRAIAWLFGVLIVIFVIVACAMGIPGVRHYVMGDAFLITVGTALFSLGTALIWLTRKARLAGRLKTFLILTGLSAAGFVVGAILHNLFYALSLITDHIAVLGYLMEALHILFFLVAIPICFPLGFLVGTVGSLVLFIRRRKKR